jgi:hypothetical protein
MPFDPDQFSEPDLRNLISPEGPRGERDLSLSVKHLALPTWTCEKLAPTCRNLCARAGIVEQYRQPRSFFPATGLPSTLNSTVSVMINVVNNVQHYMGECAI